MFTCHAEPNSMTYDWWRLIVKAVVAKSDSGIAWFCHVSLFSQTDLILGGNFNWNLAVSASWGWMKSISSNILCLERCRSNLHVYQNEIIKQATFCYEKPDSYLHETGHNGICNHVILSTWLPLHDCKPMFGWTIDFMTQNNFVSNPDSSLRLTLWIWLAALYSSK